MYTSTHRREIDTEISKEVKYLLFYRLYLVFTYQADPQVLSTLILYKGSKELE